ncbi:hypothetical protein FRX31_006325 [Thalictrum thalictroides]|uniref:Protein kinase domain-containing protein n=1 Tax=Thalictrum thalictroides TaxID=46969 RepID=A0A7J6X2U6_THATH|nr:hypothetical protein FRX31_006325 [Thalictrum thalictroides]
MNSKSELDDYFEQICKEMKILKALRDDVTTRGEPRLAGWLQIVKKKEDEIVGMETDLKRLKSYQIDAKNKLKERLASCLKAVKALVTNFGLAKISSMDNSQVDLSGNIRRARSFDAPEARLESTKKINYKSDVFSFGMLLFEILSRKKWENGNLFAKLVWEKYQSQKLDEVIRDCGIEKDYEEKAKTLSIVALLCIEHMAKDRPPMSRVVNILTDGTRTGSRKPQNPFL